MHWNLEFSKKQNPKTYFAHFTLGENGNRLIPLRKL
jgi:hypothetical protein